MLVHATIKLGRKKNVDLNDSCKYEYEKEKTAGLYL
jgi:hypothetical protein